MTNLSLLLFLLFYCCEINCGDTHYKSPTVLISFLARNKEHTLPYFLSLLEDLDYPKDRTSLWIRSDHNNDKTIEILRKWLKSVENKYHSISTEFLTDEREYPDTEKSTDWSPLRFAHIIDLRERALHFARQLWVDYILMIDCDVFLINANTLQYLIKQNKTAVAPLLKTDGMYSNFWSGMTDEYYYLRTEEYKPILERQNLGCFAVPMVHSCVLIDLQRSESDFLTYRPDLVPKYDGPQDDIIAFAISANRNVIQLTVCNEELFGYILVPLERDDDPSQDLQQLTNLKLEVLTHHEEGMRITAEALQEYVKEIPKDCINGVFRRIYMINLRRRADRRERMLKCFDELGMDVDVIDAVDGRKLNDFVLEQITLLPEYADPYHKRGMTLGEIGCFLSHYNVWKEIVAKEDDISLVLEDDIRFEPFFRIRAANLMNEVHHLLGDDWDLVYFGRKRLIDEDEPYVGNSLILVEAGYSYWTLGYALSLRGAHKLLDAEPLKKLVPVDEYLPILFNRHPNASWKQHYPDRNLRAFSAAPLLLYPTHYIGQDGYISDTEYSLVVSNGTSDEFNPMRDDL